MFIIITYENGGILPRMVNLCLPVFNKRINLGIFVYKSKRWKSLQLAVAVFQPSQKLRLASSVQLPEGRRQKAEANNQLPVAVTD